MGVGVGVGAGVGLGVGDGVGVGEGDAGVGMGVGAGEGDGAAGEEPQAAQRPHAINTTTMHRIPSNPGKHVARVSASRSCAKTQPPSTAVWRKRHEPLLQPVNTFTTRLRISVPNVLDILIPYWI